MVAYGSARHSGKVTICKHNDDSTLFARDSTNPLCHNGIGDYLLLRKSDPPALSHLIMVLVSQDCHAASGASFGSSTTIGLPRMADLRQSAGVT